MRQQEESFERRQMARELVLTLLDLVNGDRQGFELLKERLYRGTRGGMELRYIAPRPGFDRHRFIIFCRRTRTVWDSFTFTGIEYGDAR